MILRYLGHKLLFPNVKIEIKNYREQSTSFTITKSNGYHYPLYLNFKYLNLLIY